MMHTDSTETVQSFFYQEFGQWPDRVWQAPGRVNLIGEHTDYNGGQVLPCGLNMYTSVAISKRRDHRVRLVSERFMDDPVTFSLQDVQSMARKTHWSRYVPAVLASIMDSGKTFGGCDIAISSDVPDGAGLSSSAALEVALGAAVSDLFDLNLSLEDIALMGQRAENVYVDCQCGIMDQLVSACALEEHALLIDCRTLEKQPIRVPQSMTIVVIHSGIQRGLVDSAYNERRLECERAARVLGVAHLCDATLSELSCVQDMLPAKVYRRAHHVLSENDRCMAMADALTQNDLSRMRTLMRASHLSLKDDFEVSLPHIDALVEQIHGHFGEGVGVRLTGGGFGGCIVVVCPSHCVENLETEILPWYQKTTGHQARLWVSSPVHGVRRVKGAQ